MTALLTTRRLVVTAWVAVTSATGAVALWPAPTAGLAACPSGEEMDTYTESCVPYLVPNSPAGNSPCPPGVSGAECGSAEIRSPVTPPLAPTGPGQQLQDVSTPDF